MCFSEFGLTVMSDILKRTWHRFEVVYDPVWMLNESVLGYFTMTREDHIKELMTIPGVGQSIAGDLHRIGIRSVNDLKGKKPEELYDQSNALAGKTQDRCLLYVFRCAVYFADTKAERRNPEKLKWWNWKDKNKR
jgi:hypothetical protein